MNKNINLLNKMFPKTIGFNIRRNIRVNTIYKISKSIEQPINRNSNKQIALSNIHDFNFNGDDLIKQKINLYQLKKFSTNNNIKKIPKPSIFNTNTHNNYIKMNNNTNNNTNTINLIRNSNSRNSRNHEKNTVDSTSKNKKNIIFNSYNILSNEVENKYKNINNLHNFEILSPKDSKQNNFFNIDSKKNINLHKISNDLIKSLKRNSHERHKLNCKIIKIEKNISSKNVISRNNSRTNSLKECKTCKNNNQNKTKKFFYKKYNITKKMKLKKISKSQNKEREENNAKTMLSYYRRHLRKISFAIQLPKINRISLNERVFKKTDSNENYLYNENNLDYYFNNYFSPNNNKKKYISRVFMNNPLIREKIQNSLINNELINNID